MGYYVTAKEMTSQNVMRRGDNKYMSKKGRYIALSIGVLPLIILIGIWLQTRPMPPQTVEQVEELINSEIPSGASKSQVEAFLGAHGITHSEYVKYKVANPAETETDLQDKKLEGKTHRIKNYIFANTPNRKRWSIFRSDIQIMFYFDGADNLVDYLIKEVEDGP